MGGLAEAAGGGGGAGLGAMPACIPVHPHSPCPSALLLHLRRCSSCRRRARRWRARWVQRSRRIRRRRGRRRRWACAAWCSCRACMRRKCLRPSLRFGMQVCFWPACWRCAGCDGVRRHAPSLFPHYRRPAAAPAGLEAVFAAAVPNNYGHSVAELVQGTRACLALASWVACALLGVASSSHLQLLGVA